MSAASSSGDESADGEDDDDDLDSRYDFHLVSTTSLSRLLRFCPDCGDPVIHQTKSRCGTMVTVHLTCKRGCSVTWRSQEVIPPKQPIGKLRAEAKYFQ